MLFVFKNVCFNLSLSLFASQEYSFQITLRQEWHDNRLGYTERIYGMEGGWLGGWAGG